MMDVGREALDLLDLPEVAKRLRLSKKTVDKLIYAWEKAKKAGVPIEERPGIESVKVGARRLVDPEAVIEYKRRLTAEARKDVA